MVTAVLIFDLARPSFLKRKKRKKIALTLKDFPHYKNCP